MIDIQDLLKLSPEERAEIAEALISSLQPASGPSEDEVIDRLHAYRENPEQELIGWQELCVELGWQA